MAKILQGKELASAQAAVGQLIKSNYAAGNRSVTTQEGLEGVNLTARNVNYNTPSGYWANYRSPQAVSKQPSWLEKVAKQTGSIALGAAGIVKDAAITTVKDVGLLASRAVSVVPTLAVDAGNRFLQSRINNKSDNIYKMYKEGKIEQSEFLSRLSEVTAEQKQLSDMMSGYQNLLGHIMPTKDNGDINWTEAGISTISAMATVATFGAGGAAVNIGRAATRAAATKFIAPKLAQIGGRSITGGIGKTAATTATKLGTVVEKAVAKNPSWAAINSKAMTKVGTTEGAKAFVKNAMVETAIRAPIRRENIRFTIDVLDEYKKGNYFSSDDGWGAVPSTVLVAGSMTAGGAIGFVTKYVPKAGIATRKAMYGEPSLFDDLTTALNERGFKGNIAEGIAVIRTTGTKEMNDNMTNYLKQLQEYNLNGRSSKVAAAAMADAIEQKLVTAGAGPGSVNMQHIVEDMFTWVKSQDALIPLNKALGKNGHAVVAKYSTDTEKALSKSISDSLNSQIKATSKLATHEQRMAARKAIAKGIIEEEVANGAYWTHNADVVNAILRSIDNAKTIGAIVNAPKIVNARQLAKFGGKHLPKELSKHLPKSLRNQLGKDGYAVIIKKYERASLKSADEVSDEVLKIKEYIPVNDGIFEQSAQSKVVFKSIGSALTKAGIGLDESSKLAYKTVRNNATDYIDEIAQGKGAPIVNALQQFVEDGGLLARTSTDLRMLTLSEIQTALKPITKKTISRSAAKQISKAIIQAHLDAPLNMQGLANKLISGSYKFNPLYKHYARAQGTLRYTWNPFFRTQEIVETEMLGQALAGGKKPWMIGFGKIAGKSRKQLDEVVERMDNAGFYHDGMVATRYGEAAEDVFLGRMNANITKTQKRSIAGVVDKMAQRFQMPVEDLIKKHPQEILDMVRPIIQYPSKGVLNSNMAKALNIAVFPARYNIKVTGLAVKALGDAPPAVQLAVVDKLWQFENWMNSEDGVAWQRENAEALGVLQWLTPIGSVQWAFDVLGAPFGKGKDSVFDLGMVGGLPFGVISQMLDSQGWVKMSTPYVSPEEGEIYTKRIPESMKARAASALSDLLGSTFTYPGRVLGLPGKGKALRDVANIPFPNDSSEWTNKIYGQEDLPELAQYKQEIWRNQYLKEMGYNVDDIPAVAQYRNIVNGEILPDRLGPSSRKLTKTELFQLKEASKAAKSSSKDAKDAAKAKAKIADPRALGLPGL